MHRVSLLSNQSRKVIILRMQRLFQHEILHSLVYIFSLHQFMRMFVLTIALMNEKMLEDDRSPLFFMEDIQFFLIQFEQVKLEFREAISSICFF